MNKLINKEALRQSLIKVKQYIDDKLFGNSESLKDLISEEISKGLSTIVDSAPETLDTLKEVAEYIAKDEQHAVEVTRTLSNHESAIQSLQTDNVIVKGDVENSAVLKGGNNQTTCANEVALGKYNKSNSSTCLSVGIGTSNTDRRNAFEINQNGDVYIKGIGGYDGTNIEEATDLSTVLNTINEYSITNTTYSELKSIKDNSQLIPGQQYKFLFRSVVSSNYISDEQSFYLIVTAETENTLSNKAKADRDNNAQNNTEAFNNSKFSEWEIWYDIDNNTDKYDWAVEGGLGVIYHMIDEYGNDVYYDFKNIRRKRDDRNAAYLFTQKGNSREDGNKYILEPVDESIESSVLGWFRNNKVEYNTYNSKIYICSINILPVYTTDIVDNNTVVIDCPVESMPGKDVVVGVSGINNYVRIFSGSSDILLGTYIRGDDNKLNGVANCTVVGDRNTLGIICSNIDIKGHDNVFGRGCYDIKIITRDTGFSRSVESWKFGDYCQRLRFISKSGSDTIYNIHVTDCTSKVGQVFEYQIEPNNRTSEITNIYLDTTDNTLKSYKGNRFGITADVAIEAAKIEAFGVIIINFATNEFYMSNPLDGEMAQLHVWMLNATIRQQRRGIGVHYFLEDGAPGYTFGNIFVDKTKGGQSTLQFTAEGYTYTSVAGEDGNISFTKEPVKLADWNAKEGEAGYIENRTHYVTGTAETINANGEWSITKTNIIVNDDSIIDISWNIDFMGNHTEGSCRFTGTDESNSYSFDNDGFHIDFQNHGGLIDLDMWAFGGADPHYGTVTISVDLKYKTLDEVYIPDTIARNTQLEQLQNILKYSSLTIIIEDWNDFYNKFDQVSYNEAKNNIINVRYGDGSLGNLTLWELCDNLMSFSKIDMKLKNGNTDKKLQGSYLSRTFNSNNDDYSYEFIFGSIIPDEYGVMIHMVGDSINNECYVNNFEI